MGPPSFLLFSHHLVHLVPRLVHFQIWKVTLLFEVFPFITFPLLLRSPFDATYREKREAAHSKYRAVSRGL